MRYIIVIDLGGTVMDLYLRYPCLDSCNDNKMM